MSSPSRANAKYGGHAFGFPDFGSFSAGRDSVRKWISEYSPYAWVTTDDPPVYLYYLKPPAIGHPQEDTAHSANFGAKLDEKLRTAGVPCEFVYPGAPGIKHAQMADYLIDRLKAPAAK